MVLSKPGMLVQFLAVVSFGSGVNRLSLTKVWFSLLWRIKQVGIVGFGPERVWFQTSETTHGSHPVEESIAKPFSSTVSVSVMTQMHNHVAYVDAPIVFFLATAGTVQLGLGLMT
jgi:hypothetical protein